MITTVAERPLFERLDRLVDLVGFVPLADGLPTPVEQLAEGLWVQRDDLSSSLYGGNKVRKFEFVLAVPDRRRSTLVTAGGIGSHHVLAAAIHGRRLGLALDTVQYPQPITDDVARTQALLDEVGGVKVTRIASPYLMPVALAARLAAHATRPAFLLMPGASTPIGALGHVSAGLELIDAFAAMGEREPDDVVVALGSGGTAVGLALGLRLGGWSRAQVVAVRVADVVVTNPLALAPMVAGTQALLGLAGALVGPPRLVIDGNWFGPGYGVPTDDGRRALDEAAGFGMGLEPTYTAKAFAAALQRVRAGRRVVFVQTFADHDRART